MFTVKKIMQKKQIFKKKTGVYLCLLKIKNHMEKNHLYFIDQYYKFSTS